MCTHACQCLTNSFKTSEQAATENRWIGSGKRGGTIKYRQAETRLHLWTVYAGGDRRKAEQLRTPPTETIPFGEATRLPHADAQEAVGGATPERLRQGAGTRVSRRLALIGCCRDWAGSPGGPPRGGACSWASRREKDPGLRSPLLDKEVCCALGSAGGATVWLTSPSVLDGAALSFPTLSASLLPLHSKAEARSLGGAAQPELLDPEEAPSPASAMEPTAPSLTEEDLTEVKKDVSSTTLPRCRRGLGAGGGWLQYCGRGKRKLGKRRSPSRNWRRSPGSEKRNVQEPQDRDEPCMRGTLVEVTCPPLTC